MSSKSKVIWTIKELMTCLRERQLNEFDVNIGVSGKRGNGKSTLLFKFFNSFKNDGFIQEKHQVYSQDAVIQILGTQRFGFCWDDEAINSGYKRDFQASGQKRLIKVVTNFRDSYNMYASALPFFYSLDKDLRELIFCHIHIIERGLAVILLPLEDQIHESDPWDTNKNIKIERKENERCAKNPDITFRYHKYTTFAGYLYFGDMTAKQKRKYMEIKRVKRAKNFDIKTGDKKEVDFKSKVYNLLMDGKLTKEGLKQLCLIEDKKYTSMTQELNRMLTNNGESNTLKEFFHTTAKDSIHNSLRGGITDLVPSLSP